jgi:hypothetical protein
VVFVENACNCSLVPLSQPLQPVAVRALPSRRLKKSASFVLAALGSSTYQTRVQNRLRCLSVRQEPKRDERFKRSLVCTSSPPRGLRPRWTAFLNLLWALELASEAFTTPTAGGVENGLSTATSLLRLQGPSRPGRHSLTRYDRAVPVYPPSNWSHVSRRVPLGGCD